MPLLIKASKGTDKEKYAAKVELIKALLAMVPVFTRYDYFMSNEYSIVDCSMSVILHRLPELGIVLPARAKPIMDYAERLFNRTAFKESIGVFEEV
ncbi:glutathione binding-like protein, partial [Francisellaceae bacterium]|nr:glutathione binding-like protein [Francisellaceae bacterium]